MDSNDVQTALGAAVEEVLETMCFTPVMESNAGCGDLTTTTLTAHLEFEGDPSGLFQIAVSASLGRMLAASFLGRDDCEVSESQIAEVLCELSNMFCGAALSRLERDATFHLFHPEFSLQPGPVSADAHRRWFDLGDGILTAALTLNATAIQSA